ncbi:MAG: beta strand repeat-containing protein [Gemmatimonadaceae bacterium]
MDPAVAITTTSLPNGTRSSAYSQSLLATGGSGVYSWSVASGALPSGLTLANNGLLSGVPTSAGTSTFVVRVTSGTTTADQPLTLTVEHPAVEVTTTSLPNATRTVSYNQTLAAIGGSGIYDWSLVAGTLPSGLSLSASGVISGTPTSAATSSFTVRATSGSQQDDQLLTLTVVHPPVVVATAALPNGTRTVPYSQTLVATGGSGVFSWSVTNGSPPAGISLSSSGVLSGTPTAAGPSTFTVQASSGGSSDDQALTLTIGNPAGSASPFKLTADAIEPANVNDGRCVTEFGSGHRVADWTDLQSFNAAGGDPESAVPSSEVAWLRYDGEFGNGSALSYPFVARFPVHSGFGVYDDIGGVYALGRWSGPYRLLCLQATGGTATVPGAPTITSIQVGVGGLGVNFTAPTNNGGAAITNYEYSTNNGSTWTSRSPSSTTSPLVITGLTNGTTYQVRIRAVNSVGAGAPSAAVPGTPQPEPSEPSAPTITSISPGNGQLSVAFTAPASDGGAVITTYQYSTNNGTTWTPRSPSGTASPLVITGLTNGTTYQVRIRALNSVGAGPASTAVPGTPQATITVPGVPSITSIQAGSGGLGVSFSAPTSNGGAAITNYDYSTDNGSTWTPRSPSGTTSPLAITGLTNGTTYQVRIRAVNSVGAGAASTSVPGTPQPIITVPGIPTITAIQGVNQGVELNFTAPTSNGGAAITNYEYSTDNGSTWAPRSPASTTSPLVITGLTNGTTYQVRLRAVNGIGASAASAAVAGTPQATISVPGAPTIGTITAGNTQLSVAFTAPASNGGAAITNYEYSTDNGSTWAPRSPSGTASPLVITGLTNGTTYQVRLRAVNSAGAGAASAAVAGTPQAPISVPGAPTIGTITAGNTQLSVAFTAPASNGGAAITNYEYSTDNGSTWTPRSPSSTASPLVITGLTNGATYQVRLRAVNSAGAGASSAAVSGTPQSPITVPGAPTIGTITAGNTQLSLAFTAPASNGGAAITNYEYSTNNGSTWTPRSPSGIASPLVIGGLTNGTTYQVRLRAVNSAGAGDASGAVNGTPVHPLSLCTAAANVGSGSLFTRTRTLSASACDIDGYLTEVLTPSSTAPSPVLVQRNAIAPFMLGPRVRNISTGAVIANSVLPIGWDFDGAALVTNAPGANQAYVLAGASGASYDVAFSRCGFAPRLDNVEQSVSVPNSCTSSSGGSEMIGLAVLSPAWSTFFADIEISASVPAGIAAEVCLLKYPFTNTATQQCSTKSAASLATAVTFDVNIDDWAGSPDAIYAIRVRTTLVQVPSIPVRVRRVD